jgi:hypothetical protein
LIDSLLIQFNTDPVYVLPGMPTYDRSDVHLALGSEGPVPALRIALRDQIVELLECNPVIPTDLSDGEFYRLLFVSEAITDATSADVADYNAVVSAEAATFPDLNDLGADWKAVVSSPTMEAYENTGTDPSPPGSTGVPIYLVDNTRIADDYDQFWSGNVPGLYAPPDLEGDGDITAASRAWTGSVFNGTGPDGLEMGDVSGISFTGAPASVDATWTGSNTQPQSLLLPVYGLSDILVVPEPGTTLLGLFALGALGLSAYRQNRRPDTASRH